MKISSLIMLLMLMLIVNVVYSHRDLDEEEGYVLYIKPARRQPSTRNNCTECHTRTGKMGPRGLPGPRGPAGIVDMTIVEDLQQQVTQLIGTIANYDVRIQNLTSEIAPIRLDRICNKNRGGKVYANYCYYVLDGDKTFDNAQTACVESGGRLAPVTSTAQYDALEGFLRSIAVAERVERLSLRIAMTYDPTSAGREITSLDGTTVTWNKWFPGYPYTTSRSSSYASLTTVIWRLDKTATSTNQGFFNNPPSYSRRPLCRKSM